MVGKQYGDYIEKKIDIRGTYIKRKTVKIIGLKCLKTLKETIIDRKEKKRTIKIV